MTKTPSTGESIKKLRNALKKLTQQEFAELLGVSQATISAWEGGDTEYAPGTQAYLTLGKLAAKQGFTEDAFLFWELAGHDEKSIILAATQRMKERGEPAVPSEIVRALMRSLPKNTEVHRLDGKSAGAAFAAGDIVLLDRADDPYDFRPFWDQIVLVDFPEDATRIEWRGAWPVGFFMGRLSCGLWSPGRTTLVAKLGPLSERFDARPLLLSFCESNAREKWRLTGGPKILGRAIAWFSGSGEKK